MRKRSMVSQKGVRKIGKIKHGLTKHPLFQVWSNMLRRCSNQKEKAYKNYGGRGIKVCNEWKGDFLKFYNWANENGYKQGLTIERADNNGNYGPDNCKWVDYEYQNNNRRNTVKVDINGNIYTLSQAAKAFNINLRLIRDRYNIGLRGTALS